MATIASLLVSLGLNTAAFDSKIKKVKGQAAGGFGIGTALGGAAGITAGLAAVDKIAGAAYRAATAIAEMTATTIKEVDEISDLASVLGVTTEGLSRLQYAAFHSDVEVSDLNAALQKLSVNLDAGGKASKALADLGLSGEKLKQGELTDAFSQIADALGKVENRSEQARIARDLLGKSGAKLLPLLDQEAGGLKRLAEASDSRGNTITALDAAQIGRADEALKQVESSFQAIKRVVAVELSPAISVLADDIAGLNAKDGTGGLIGGLGSVVETISKIGSPFYESRGEIDAIRIREAKRRADLESRLDKLNANRKLKDAKVFDEEEEARGTKLKEQLQEEIDLWGKVGHARQIAGVIAEGVNKTQEAELIALGKQLDVLEKQKKVTEDLKEAAERRRSIIEGAFTAEERHAAEIAAIEKEIGDALFGPGTFKDVGADVEKLEGVKAKLEEAESKRKADEAASAKAKFDDLRTPLEVFRERMLELDAGFEKGVVDEKHFALGKLRAEADLAAADKVATDTGPERPAALERGTAAAFSASFGGQLKPLDKIAKIEGDMLVVMRKIDEKFGGVAAVAP